MIKNIIASLALSTITFTSFAADPVKGADDMQVMRSFGVKACQNFKPTVVIWIEFKDGKLGRLDANHHPATAEALSALLQELDKHPTDLIDLTTGDPKNLCGTMA